MKTLITLIIAVTPFASNANLTDSIEGFYIQKINTQLPKKKGVTVKTTNIAEVSKIDDNAARVTFSIHDQGGRCTLDAEFLKNGDALVFTKNSETGRGTCEITVANFRGRGLIIYENKDKGDCSDFCVGTTKIGVRLFDRL